jgi:hypothetical protein
MFVNHEKEEAWINGLCSKGLALTDVSLGCRFTFEDCEPGAYHYRTEFLGKFPRNPESRKYIQFMEDNGVEHVASFEMWVYFRKKASDGPFDIYSDLDSRLLHNRRIAVFMLLGGLVNAIFGSINIYIGVEKTSIFNIIIGFIAVPVGIGCLATWIKVRKKINALKREKTLRE